VKICHYAQFSLSFTNFLVGYGHPTDNLKAAKETRLQNMSFEAFLTFLAQKLGAEKQLQIFENLLFFCGKFLKVFCHFSIPNFNARKGQGWSFACFENV